MTFKGFMPQYVSVPVEWETNVDGKVVVTKFERLHCKTVEEYKDAVLQLGSWLKDPIEFTGISPNDLSILILRQIAINIEQTNS